MKKLNINIFYSFMLLMLSTNTFAQTQETRTFSNFNSIAISGGFDNITLQKGEKASVFIEAEGVELDKILTQVNGNTLALSIKKGNYHNMKISMVVTYISLAEISNSGSSDVATSNTIKEQKFEFNSSGSGDFEGSFDVEYLDINMSGSSNFVMEGRANEQNYALSGSGNINAGNLKGTSAEVAISGSSDVQLNINGSVDTSVSGSGRVRNHKE